MSPEDGSGSMLSGIRKSKYATPLGLGLAALISVLLMVFAWWVCFSFLAIALVLYGVPTIFGFKNKKWLAVFGTVMLVVLGLTWTAMMYNQTINFEGETVESPNGAMVDGMVNPAVGVPGTFYTFNVTLTSGATDADVHLYLTNDWDTGQSAITNTSMPFSHNASNGAVYSRTIQLNESGLYGFEFLLDTTGSGGSWEATYGAYGPVNANNNDILMYWLQSGMMIAFFNIGLLFYMLLLLVFWMDRSRKKMEGEMKKREAAKAVATEKMVCSECGSDVPADAEKCPQCGERFDDAQKNATAEEKKCPKCNAVIFDTDKKCWNCGTELTAPPKQG